DPRSQPALSPAPLCPCHLEGYARGGRDRYGPPARTDYRLIVENLSSRCSWQDLKVREPRGRCRDGFLFVAVCAGAGCFHRGGLTDVTVEVGCSRGQTTCARQARSRTPIRTRAAGTRAALSRSSMAPKSTAGRSGLSRTGPGADAGAPTPAAAPGGKRRLRSLGMPRCARSATFTLR
uniref:Uncharacterized protein n=1 Tax=Scleropages formosus TaxID=113540 RepID=A0A8D0CFR3_SCLFO